MYCWYVGRTLAVHNSCDKLGGLAIRCQQHPHSDMRQYQKYSSRGSRRSRYNHLISAGYRFIGLIVALRVPTSKQRIWKSFVIPELIPEGNSLRLTPALKTKTQEQLQTFCGTIRIRQRPSQQGAIFKSTQNNVYQVCIEEERFQIVRCAAIEKNNVSQ